MYAAGALPLLYLLGDAPTCERSNASVDGFRCCARGRSLKADGSTRTKPVEKEKIRQVLDVTRFTPTRTNRHEGELVLAYSQTAEARRRYRAPA